MQTNITVYPQAPARARPGSRRAKRISDLPRLLRPTVHDASTVFQCGPGKRLAKPKSEIRNPKSHSRSEIRNPKSGFTIIELLVVITIIGILMTLLIQVIGSFLTQARDSATKATISKNQGMINSRAQAFNRLIMRTGYISGSVEMQFVRATPPYSQLTPTAQNSVASKLLEMKYFPQRVNEFGTSVIYTQQSQVTGPYSALVKIYLQLFSAAQPPGQNLTDLASYDPTADANHTIRSSEILYHFLTQSNVLGGSPIGTDAFTGAEVVDTPEIPDPATGKLIGNGLPELIDAWGNPLRFYRWPTRFFRSGGVISAAGVAPVTLAPITAPGGQSNADGTYDVNNAKLLFASLPVFSGNLVQDLARDPDDPLRNCLNIPNFEINFSTAPPTGFHTPATYHVLLIVSAGPDGQMGMYEPYEMPQSATDTQHYGYLAQPILGQEDALTDNIMYLNVRAGGK